MKLLACTQLTLFLIVSISGARSLGQHVGQVPVLNQKEYADGSARLYLGASSLSPVNGNLFQAVVVKPDAEGSPYRFYIWELSMDGEKVNEWAIQEGGSTRIALPSLLVPCLRVLPTGEILTVVLDEPRAPTLIKVDVGGNVILKKSWPALRTGYPHFARIVPAADGQTFLLGGLGGKAVVWKIDEEGSILFERELGIGGAGICCDGVGLSNGILRVCGFSRDGEAVRSWVVDVNGRGEVQAEVSFDNAAWASAPRDHRIARIKAGRTAFVHPVIADGRTYCHITVLDDRLERVADVRVCEVPGYVGAFEIQQRKGDAVIAAVGLRRDISLHVLDGNLRRIPVGDARDLSLGSPMVYRLAANDDRALILGQSGSPMAMGRNAIRCIVLSLEERGGRERP